MKSNIHECKKLFFLLLSSLILSGSSLFAQNMFIGKLADASDQLENWEVISMPRCHLDPNVDGVNSSAAAVLNFSTKQVLLIGLRYAGELKKSMSCN